MPDAPLPRTLTHARLRRAQGDTAGAIAIIETLIDAGDERDDLVELYLALGGDSQRAHREPELPAEQPAVAADLASLGKVFRRELESEDCAGRVLRLRQWLILIQRGAKNVL